MKFFEFGTENKRTLMILCGYLEKWTPGLMPFINEAKKEYHVIVQAYDGFNPDEPESVFTSIVEEADMGADFIVNNLGGKVDILYGISLGGMVGNEILMDRRVVVHTFIADGYTIMPMPVFQSKIVEQLYIKGYSELIYGLLKRHRGLLALALGRRKASLDENLYTEAQKKSIVNSVITEIGYRYKTESFNLADSYIFHGTAERVAAAKVHDLKKKGVSFTHKMFRRTGHAELIHKKPKSLLRLINLAYKGKLR